MPLFNRAFRAASGVFLSVFKGDPAGGAIPLYAMATDVDAPIGVDNPMPAADIATADTNGETAVATGEAEDIFAASATPQGRRISNQGPGDATLKLGADATGAAGERKLPAGAEIIYPFRTGLKLSVFAVADTTIEWEHWT